MHKLIQPLSARSRASVQMQMYGKPDVRRDDSRAQPSREPNTCVVHLMRPHPLTRSCPVRFRMSGVPGGESSINHLTLHAWAL